MSTRYITIIAILGVFAFVLTTSRSTDLNNKAVETTEPSSDQHAVKPKTVSIEIADIFASSTFPITATSTAYSVLTRIDKIDANVQLAEEYYTGVGTLVTSMYGKNNGAGNQYWQYSIDDVLPQVAADAYVLSPGVSLKWQFSPSQY